MIQRPPIEVKLLSLDYDESGRASVAETPVPSTISQQSESPEITNDDNPKGPCDKNEGPQEGTAEEIKSNEPQNGTSTPAPIDPLLAKKGDDEQALSKKSQPPSPLPERRTSRKSEPQNGASTQVPVDTLLALKGVDKQALSEKSPPPPPQERLTPSMVVKKADPASLPSIFRTPTAARKTPERETAPVTQINVDGKYYPLADLQQKKVDGINNAHREQYLSPADFAEYFKMTKEEFARCPKWKRDKTKRSLSLF
jgi:hypothetical protein